MYFPAINISSKTILEYSQVILDSLKESHLSEIVLKVALGAFFSLITLYYKSFSGTLTDRVILVVSLVIYSENLIVLGYIIGLKKYKIYK